MSAEAVLHCNKTLVAVGSMSLVFQAQCGSDPLTAIRLAFRSWSSPGENDRVSLVSALANFVRNVNATGDPEVRLIQELVLVANASNSDTFVKTQNTSGLLVELRQRSTASLTGNLQFGIVTPWLSCEVCLRGSSPIELKEETKACTQPSWWNIASCKTFSSNTLPVSIELSPMLSGTVKDALNNKTIPRFDALRMILGICSDLLQMCRGGACHPDPHSGNILFFANWSFLWADFGMTDLSDMRKNIAQKLKSLFAEISQGSTDADVSDLALALKTSLENAADGTSTIHQLEQLIDKIRLMLPREDKDVLLRITLQPAIWLFVDDVMADMKKLEANTQAQFAEMKKTQAESERKVQAEVERKVQAEVVEMKKTQAESERKMNAEVAEMKKMRAESERMMQAEVAEMKKMRAEIAEMKKTQVESERKMRTQDATQALLVAVGPSGDAFKSNSSRQGSA